MTRSATYKRAQPQYSYKGEQALQVAASIPLKFKNLLEKIILTSNILNRELVLRGNNREITLVKTIFNSAWELWTEMSAIIDIATLETEGLCLNFQPVAVNTTICKVLDQILPRLRNRQQLLNLKLAPKSPKVMADQLRLEQVLLTLLSNASEIAAEKSSIYASSAEQGKEVTIKIWSYHHALSGSSLNASPPLTHDEQELTSELATELALCKYLIKLHKGKLWLPNEITSGNAFVLVLPSISN